MPKPPGYIVFVDEGTEHEADIDVLRDTYGTPVLFAAPEDAKQWTDADPKKYKVSPLVRFRKPRTQKPSSSEEQKGSST